MHTQNIPPIENHEQPFGDIIHSIGEQNPLAVGFGCCCCSCSSSAAVYVNEELTDV